MRFMALLVVILATACAGKGGSWPSLARRPVEGPIPVVVTALAGQASVAPAPEAPPPAIADVAARLSTIERDRVDIGMRIATQLAATRSAAAARGSRTDGDAWSKAQLESSRLERLGNQASDLHDRLDAIAGMLAEVGATGADVATPLKATGQSIGRVRALEAEVTAGVAAAAPAKP